jgi:hypothetical protein
MFTLTILALNKSNFDEIAKHEVLKTNLTWMEQNHKTNFKDCFLNLKYILSPALFTCL